MTRVHAYCPSLDLGEYLIAQRQLSSEYALTGRRWNSPEVVATLFSLVEGKSFQSSLVRPNVRTFVLAVYITIFVK